MSQLLRLSVIAALMSAFLVSMLVTHALARSGGQEVLLDVQGYDPRDPLLGYYSRIRVDIWSLDLDEVEGESEFAVRDEIFVTVQPDADGIWQARTLNREPPETGVFLRGRVTGTSTSAGEWVEPVDPETGETSPVFESRDIRRVFVNYNLNRYYASRETAQALDGILRDNSQTPRLIISVQPDGTALIKGMEIAGERQLERLW